MTAKTNARCNVNADDAGAITCNPDPVPVKRSTNNGVEWVFNKTGYTFTGIDITHGNDTDFGTPAISTNTAQKSVMTVTDTVADLKTYSYTLCYTDPNGTAHGHDPQIHNEA